MRRFLSIIALSVASLVATAAAPAGGPPVVNSTEHSFDQPFFDSPTLDSGSGNAALGDGVFSGVFHTLVKPDGSLNLSAKVRGTAQLDDLPTDGVIDATSRFVFNFTDIVFATGRRFTTPPRPGP